MRTFGVLCIAVGVALFIYAGDQRALYEPVPEETSVVSSLKYPAGRWEVARYGGALTGALGLLLTLFPKGR